MRISVDWASLYPYTADLMCLEFCRPFREHHCQALLGGATPLMGVKWEQALKSHPDKAFRRYMYIMTGLQEGFEIEFDWSLSIKSAPSNMGSAQQHPDIIREYLHKELRLGRMLGLFTTTSSLPDLHVSRFGVIPKGHNSAKWRLIMDLSYLPGASVNDGIDSSICSLTYTSVDEVARVAASYGHGALLAKKDIEAAYRLIPVHPQDRPLLAMSWEGKLAYIAPMLPFGLLSAPMT